MGKTLVFKVGSQKGEFGAKEGMVVAMLAEDEPLSDHMKKCFASVVIDESQVAAVREQMEPRKSGTSTHGPKGFIDLADLAESLGDESLLEKWRGPDIVGVKDATEVDLEFSSTEMAEWDDIDNNAVSTGSWTVGPAKDYATWNAAVADIIDLTGDLTFMQDASIASDGGAGAPSIDLNGFTLTCGNNSPHGGDPTVGYVTNITTNISNMIHIVQNGSDAGADGMIEISDLNFRISVAVTEYKSCVEITARDELRIHDIIVYCAGASSGGGDVAGIWTSCAINTSGTSNQYIWNCEVAGYSSGTWNGIRASKAGYVVNMVVENCTVHDCVTGFDGGSSTAEFNNNLAFDCSTACYENIASAVGNNNADDDATGEDADWGTGANNQSSITVVNEIDSVDVTNTDYLKVLNTGVCWDGGIAPTIPENTVGIRGDGRYNVSIGADEFPGATAPGTGSGSGSGLSGAITAAMNAGYR